MDESQVGCRGRRMWTWRESNPRPHKETICFLHAYLGLWFWCNSKTRATDCCLSLFGFHMSSEAYSCYFRFILHRLFFGFGKRSSERCLVPSPCDGIKPIVYCASTRQRERNYFRQLNFCSLCFRSQLTRLRMLAYHFVLPSIPIRPWKVCVAKVIFFGVILAIRFGQP